MDELIKRLEDEGRAIASSFAGDPDMYAFLFEAADALTSQQSHIAALELQVSGERGQKEIWETRAKEWCESSTALIEDNDSLRKSLNGESEARCALEDEVKALRKAVTESFMNLHGVIIESKNDRFDDACIKTLEIIERWLKDALSAASDGGGDADQA